MLWKHKLKYSNWPQNLTSTFIPFITYTLCSFGKKKITLHYCCYHCHCLLGCNHLILNFGKCCIRIDICDISYFLITKLKYVFNSKNGTIFHSVRTEAVNCFSSGMRISRKFSGITCIHSFIRIPFDFCPHSTTPNNFTDLKNISISIFISTSIDDRLLIFGTQCCSFIPLSSRSIRHKLVLRTNS